MVFSFDVQVSTHDALQQGHTAIRLAGSPHTHHRIVVEAQDRTEAALVASWMAGRRGMVTAVFDRI